MRSLATRVISENLSSLKSWGDLHELKRFWFKKIHNKKLKAKVSL